MKAIVAEGGIAGFAATRRLREGRATDTIVERAAELGGPAEDIDGQDLAPRTQLA